MQNKPVTLEIQKAAFRCKLISGNNMAEVPRRTLVCHLNTQKMFQYVTNEILQRNNPKIE